MQLNEIKSLMDAMAASDLSEMAVTRDGTLLRLVRRQAEARATPVMPVIPAVRTPRAGTAPAPEAPRTEITAPLYGVVHWRPAPDAAPFVAPGQAIQAGQVVCVVEAMKVFNEVRAEADATVLALLVASGAEVEAGQPLMRLA